MLGEERRKIILRELSSRGAITVTGLRQTLGYSETTLRRDLQRMARAGLLRRSHGGAVIDAADDPAEPSLSAKAVLYGAEKEAIGAAAARLVGAGDIIALNGGTTTVQVARALRAVTGLYVVTNSIGVATELAGLPGLQITVTGGALRGSGELTGPLAEQSLKDLYVQTAFLGVDGLTVRHGLTTYNATEAHTNRAIIARAERVIVVADHTKIGRVTTALIAPCTAISMLITDMAAPPAHVAELRDAGIEVITV